MESDTADDKYRAENGESLFAGEFGRMRGTTLSGFTQSCSEMDESPDLAQVP
jgi:hypothetical protein